MNAFQTGYIAGMVCSLVFFLGLGLAVAAVVLRSACALCKEEVPDFGRAMGISFAQGAANGLVSLLIQFGVIRLISTNPGTAQVAATLISLPFGMLIAASIIHSTVPTSTFSKAVLIWLIQIVIMVAVLFGVGLVLGLILAGVGLRR